MNASVRFSFAAGVLACLASSGVFARGGSSSHGGDLERDQDNVWFLGPEVVEYCVNAEGAFVNRKQASALVEQALADWKSFFHKYEIHLRTFNGLKGGRSLGLSLDFKEVETCSKPVEQIQFAFGAKPKLVEIHRPDKDTSLGVAVRFPYNHDTYRTGGVVWIDGDLKEQLHIRHMLLHELGHVFGMQHNSVWVMEDTVGRRLTDARESKDPAIGMIESPAWPFVLRPGDRLDLTYRFQEDANPKGFAPNYILSGGILNSLGMQKNFFGQHRITIQYETRFDPGVELPLGRNVFILTVEDEGGGTTILEGKFDNTFKRDAGPYLFTGWSAKTGVIYEPKHLYQGTFPIPAHGYFLKGEKKIPAVISTHWGPVLKLFVEETGQWWDSLGYEMSRERRIMDDR